MDSPLYGARQVVNRQQYGGEKYADAKTKHDYHNGFNEVDQRIHRGRHLTLIELGQRREDISELSGLLSHAHHLNENVRKLFMLLERH